MIYKSLQITSLLALISISGSAAFAEDVKDLAKDLTATSAAPSMATQNSAPAIVAPSLTPAQPNSAPAQLNAPSLSAPSSAESNASDSHLTAPSIVAAPALEPVHIEPVVPVAPKIDEKFMTKLVDAHNAGNIDEILSMYATDFTVIDADGKSYNDKNALKLAMSDKLSEAQTKKMKISLRGEKSTDIGSGVALLTGYTDYNSEDAHDKMSTAYTAVAKYDGVDWKIISLQKTKDAQTISKPDAPEHKSGGMLGMLFASLVALGVGFFAGKKMNTSSKADA